MGVRTGKTLRQARNRLRQRYEEACQQYSYQCDISTRNYIQLFKVN